eukprot:2510164-Rhodomonas_salina.2
MLCVPRSPSHWQAFPTAGMTSCGLQCKVAASSSHCRHSNRLQSHKMKSACLRQHSAAADRKGASAKTAGLSAATVTLAPDPSHGTRAITLSEASASHGGASRRPTPWCLRYYVRH